MKTPAQIFNIDEKTQQIIVDAASKFKGRGTTLESALGAVTLGQLYGWRVLKMIHNPSTYSKYEKLLGIQFKDVCPETTKLSKRNGGFKIADKLNSFWAIVKGRIDAPNKANFLDENS